MSALPKMIFTPQEYRVRECQAEFKSEYVAGEIFAPAGTQPKHNRVAVNIVSASTARFRGRSGEAFMSDVRLRVPVCGRQLS